MAVVAFDGNGDGLRLIDGKAKMAIDTSGGGWRRRASAFDGGDGWRFALLWTTALVAVTQQLRWQQKVMAAVATAGAVIGDSDEDNDRYDDDNGGGGERGSDGDSGCDRCVYSDEQRRRGR